MVRRRELTDEAWVKPPLPEGGRKEHRTVTNGILWKLRTGAPWRDLPERKDQRERRRRGRPPEFDREA
jgi:transposase